MSGSSLTTYSGFRRGNGPCLASTTLRRCSRVSVWPIKDFHRRHTGRGWLQSTR
jgi:hypothetical protein